MTSITLNCNESVEALILKRKEPNDSLIVVYDSARGEEGQDQYIWHEKEPSDAVGQWNMKLIHHFIPQSKVFNHELPVD